MSFDLFGYEPPERRKPTAVELRNAALKRVKQNSGVWFDRAIVALRLLPPGWDGIGEDMRHFVEDRVGRPPHRNVMGALVKRALKSGIVVKTGEFRKMTDPQSNARESRVYRRQ